MRKYDVENELGISLPRRGLPAGSVTSGDLLNPTEHLSILFSIKQK
jgi:hypothetical protein